MKRKILALMVCLALVATALVFPATAAAVGTTEVTITKYTNGISGTSVTKTYLEMEAGLPVQGDGSTNYFHQGPNTTDPWNPAETLSLKDKGKLKGTTLKDLCDLVGGACPGDTIEVVASDAKTWVFQYNDVYDQKANVNNTSQKECPPVLCWWKDGQYVPSYSDGMRLIFFDAMTNAAGQHVFGNEDMRQCLDPSSVYYYAPSQPSTDGLAAKYVTAINIYHAGDPCPAVPETNTFILIGTGILSLVGFIWVARRRKAAQSQA